MTTKANDSSIIKALNKISSKGHRKRLRDRFIKSGLAGFADYEVVELLLTIGTPRKDCKKAAKLALEKFKTFQGVVEASIDELSEIDGIGINNQFGIQLIKEVSQLYLEKKIEFKESINNSKQLFDYLYHSLRDKKQETFKAIFLNTKNKIIAIETLFEGSITSAAVYPREVIRKCLMHNAYAVIFAHNHPSGDPDPSESDLGITKKLLFACSLIGTQVCEHIIIGDNKYFSFADQGYIEQINKEFKTMG